MSPQYRVGIDVGGTFTDIFVVESVSGKTYTHKVSSTPGDPHRAPIEGMRQLLERIGAHGDQVTFVGLGTTVATNALLEGKGARTGMITTSGFRDLLEIGRQTRPHLYDRFARKARLLVPRQLRLEVPERLDSGGKVIVPLDEGAVIGAVDALKSQGVEAVAICFLNAYANPCHENRALEIVRQRWPEVHAVTSFQVMPEFREYERFVSTTVNAYLMPSMRDYFRAFESAVADLGIRVSPVVMSSSGGVFTPALAGQRPIDTLFSGPSGGVSSSVFLASIAQRNDIITFDMGGTSTEVCLVRNGQPQLSHSRSIKGHQIRTTSHDIHTIGAGGSSIGQVDQGGMLEVGPESAGADPGPACYASGGAFATVTDANVILGRLNQEYLLGGSLKIDARKSHHAIECHVAARKRSSVDAAALSMVELAEANMAQALRVVSVERGIDPKDFTLVALGGAGPLHAASVARSVGMAGVLIPPHPGVLCAMGVLTKDIQLNFSRTKILDEKDPYCCSAAGGTFSELEAEARSAFADQATDTLRIERSAAVRYRGQNHELSIAVPEGVFDDLAVRSVADRFHSAHHELYGYAFRENPIEFVTLRLTAIVPVERPKVTQESSGATIDCVVPVATRAVKFDAASPSVCPVFSRTSLPVGARIEGPAIIEQMDTTTVLPPGFQAVIDPWRNLSITWHEDEVAR